jgi:hypothetical protein
MKNLRDAIFIVDTSDSIVSDMLDNRLKPRKKMIIEHIFPGHSAYRIASRLNIIRLNDAPDIQRMIELSCDKTEWYVALNKTSFVGGGRAIGDALK